jgi:hypothetical protein
VCVLVWEFVVLAGFAQGITGFSSASHAHTRFFLCWCGDFEGLSQSCSTFSHASPTRIQAMAATKAANDNSRSHFVAGAESASGVEAALLTQELGAGTTIEESPVSDYSTSLSEHSVSERSSWGGSTKFEAYLLVALCLPGFVLALAVVVVLVVAAKRWRRRVEMPSRAQLCSELPLRVVSNPAGAL